MPEPGTSGATPRCPIEQSPAIPPEVKSQASVELQGDVPLLSDAQLRSALDEAGGALTQGDTVGPRSKLVGGAWSPCTSAICKRP